MSRAILEEVKLNILVRKQVIAVLREFLDDPDFGLELRPEFETRLRKSINSKKVGRTINLERILEKYKVR